MELDKQTIKKIIGLISFAILLSWGLKNTEFIKRLIALALGLLQPFLIGGVIAFVVNVPMRALENACFIKPYQKRLAAQAAAKPAGKGSTVPAKPPIWYRAKRPLSLILSLLLVIGIIGVGTLIVVPETVSSFSSIVNNLRNFPLMLNQWAQELMDWMPQAAVWLEELNLNLDLTSIDWREIITQVVNFLQNGAGNVLNTTFTVASGIFNGIVTGFLAIVFSFYLLMNKEKLGSQTKQLLYALLKEPHADYLVRVGQMTNRTFSKFLSGQCVEAVILATLFFVSMSILRFPYAMIISTLIAFTALIPIFGAFIGCVVGAFLILLVDPVRAFWFVVLFLFLQQFEGNLIYPKVVGSTIGLPGVWVMTAVTIFSNLFGILGIILGTPIAAVLYTVMRRVTTNRLAARGLSNADLEPGKYPYLENSHYAAGYSKGRPLCAPVLERAAKKKEQGKKPLFLKFKTSKKK